MNHYVIERAICVKKEQPIIKFNEVESSKGVLVVQYECDENIKEIFLIIK